MKTNLAILGYTNKWVEYGFIDDEILESQILVFNEGEDKNTEHYRYSSFLKWIKSKTSISNKELENYLELAENDSDKTMAGSAVSGLFCSSIINTEQYEIIKVILDKYGNWTEKLIARENLKRNLKSTELNQNLFQNCLSHKEKFNDNLPLKIFVNRTKDENILLELMTNKFSKKIKNMASERLIRIKKAPKN